MSLATLRLGNGTSLLNVSQFSFFILHTTICGSYLSCSVSSDPSECWCWLWTTAACSGGTLSLSPSNLEVVALSSRSAWGLSSLSHCQSSRSSCRPADPWLWSHECPGVRQIWRGPCRCKWGNASLRVTQVERHTDKLYICIYYWLCFLFQPT